MENRIITETPQVIELKKLLKEAVEVVRYSESQFRYIYNVSDRVDVSECANHSGNKSREFLETLLVNGEAL